MKLQTVDIPAQAKSLVIIVRGGGQSLGPFRQVEAVAVPLKNQGLVRNVPQQGVHLSFERHSDRIPANLLEISRVDLSADCRSNELGAEAYPQQRDTVFYSAAYNGLFPFEKRIFLLLINSHRPAKDNQGLDLLPALGRHLVTERTDITEPHISLFQYVSKTSQSLFGFMLENQDVFHG